MEGDLCDQGLVTFAASHTLVVASGTNDLLVGLDRQTGKERFRVKTSEYGKATVLLQNDSVFVGKAGVLECFGLDGKRRWREAARPRAGPRRSRGFGLDGKRRWREGFSGMGNRSVSLALGDQVVLADDA